MLIGDTSECLILRPFKTFLPFADIKGIAKSGPACRNWISLKKFSVVLAHQGSYPFIIKAFF